MEDKKVQINMGDENNPKPICIGESLPPVERKDIVALQEVTLMFSHGTMKTC